MKGWGRAALLASAAFAACGPNVGAGLGIRTHDPDFLEYEPMDRCRPSVDEVLSVAGIPQSDVEKVEFTFRRLPMGMMHDEDDEGWIDGYDAWVDLHSCSGYVIFVMSRQCIVRLTSTRGDCPMPNLPAR